MKHLLTLILIFSIAIVSLGQGTRKASSISLAGTTWKIYYDFCGGKDWTEHGTITFLQGGRIKDSKGHWKLTGSNLIVEGATEIYVDEMKVVVRDNQMTGQAALGMNPRGFCVRVVRQDNNTTGGTPISPSKSSAVRKSALVYFSSGMGGTGGGEFHLKLNGRAVTFYYDNRMRFYNFQNNPHAYDVGAAWRIIYSDLTDNNGELSAQLWSATFTGRVVK